MIEILKGVKNIDLGLPGQSGKIQTAILEEYDTVKWNNLAKNSNTRMFIQVHGREPVNYEEVRIWVHSLSGQKEKPAAVTAS